MSFPSTVYGSYGDEKVTSASKIGGLPLGTRMELPDGRIFRQVQASATALIAGKLYQSEAQVADTMYQQQLVTGSAVVGATAITITTGGTTAVTVDQFEDGYLLLASSAGGGVGEVYKIRTNGSAAAGSAAASITLQQTDPLVSAIAGGTTKTGLRQNEYKNVLLSTADTVRVGPVAGVPPTAIPAASFGWLQRRGYVSYFASATLAVVGLPVVAATQAAGAFSVWFAAASANNLSWATEAEVGYCVTAAGTAENFGMMNLNLE